MRSDEQTDLLLEMGAFKATNYYSSLTTGGI